MAEPRTATTTAALAPADDGAEDGDDHSGTGSGGDGAEDGDDHSGTGSGGDGTEAGDDDGDDRRTRLADAGDEQGGGDQSSDGHSDKE